MTMTLKQDHTWMMRVLWWLVVPYGYYQSNIGLALIFSHL